MSCAWDGATPRIFALRTTNIARKYSGMLDVLLSSWDEPWLYCTPPDALRVVWAAMSAHESQFVWFRRVFVVFSRYTFMNTLVEIHVKGRSD